MKMMSELMSHLEFQFRNFMLSHLDPDNKNKFIATMADVLAQAHDIGADRCALVIQDLKQKNDTCEHEILRLEEVNRGIIKRLDTQIRERKLQDQLDEQLDVAKSQLDTLGERLWRTEQTLETMTTSRNTKEDLRQDGLKEIERLKKLLDYKDECIAKLYQGDVCMVQVTDRMRPYDWKTLACFTNWEEAGNWSREMGVRSRDEIVRVVSMKLNPALPGHD